MFRCDEKWGGFRYPSHHLGRINLMSYSPHLRGLISLHGHKVVCLSQIWKSRKPSSANCVKEKLLYAMDSLLATRPPRSRMQKSGDHQLASVVRHDVL